MPDRRTGFVRRVFSEVPETYELVNHVLTLGLDIGWRRQAARIAALAGGGRWVDMCTGTGEMAANLSHLAPERTTVHAVDFSLPMLAEARGKREAERVSFAASEVRALSFADDSFDLITMSFATRNVNLSRPALVQTFAEYCRVLKPGGRFVNLETSRPSSSFVRRCFHLYIRLFVKAIGSRVSGSRTAYAYLAKTIPRFYAAEELAGIIRQAGFGEVTFDRRMFGAVAIHRGVKLPSK